MILLLNFISENLLKKLPFWNLNDQDRIINKEVMDKRTLTNENMKFCNNQ